MSQLFSGKDIWEIDTTSFQEIILLSGGFRRETASGFYPWGKVEGPRKRAALGLWCGWFKPLLEIRHATALTTGAKHWHRQKAVFYVFCFCATSIYPLNPDPSAPQKNRRLVVPLTRWLKFSLLFIWYLLRDLVILRITTTKRNAYGTPSSKKNQQHRENGVDRRTTSDRDWRQRQR